MSDISWSNQKRKLGELKPWVRNPRQINKDQAKRLSESFDEFGQVETIAVGPDNEVYNGHQRLSVLLDKHGKDYEVEVRVSSRALTEKEREKLTVFLHKGAAGEWNFDMLANEFEVDELVDWGFAPEELGIEIDKPVADAEPQIDKAAELNEKWQVKAGDLWQIGEHRLLCGDSTKREDVERVMQDEKADLCFTDPPYRMEAEGGSNQPVGKAARKLGESIKDLVDFDPIAFLEIIPTVFASHRMNTYIFCNKDLVPDYLFWGRNNGYSFNILFWKKPNAIPLGGSHRPDVEYLLLFRKNAIWNNNLPEVSYSKCLSYGRDDGDEHPTIKPIELVANEIQISSMENNIVFEPFCGSGTTMVACENLSRKCRAIEISPNYCAVILERMATAFPELTIERIIQNENRTS